MITGTSNYDEVPTIPCKICGGYFKADDPENHKCEGQPNEQHRQQELLVSKAKASVFTMGYISQFEASDIDSDDIDLRFEVDGVETGTTVSIVDESGHAAQIITALLDELEHYKSREERVTKLVLDNSASWDALYKKVEAAEKHIAELEARKVNLSKLSVGEVMHMSGFSRDYAEGWCAGNDNAIHEIRAAGIKVKGE
ncbi:ead/Ea22-like family protein [Salmonella enterica subsp. enterica serovar Weltevreden]|uniref:Ead/Ea22-like family protein n=4 Tax=Salmonella enterica TaxID=28901 RepID=A0A5U8II77_SALNE|nr:ead/Ea22-like family protein [Salmonella enterica]YP_003090242.1 ead/Ea22-like family protein [Salmonella phage g341c]EAA4902401.1 ead/Ea22-like family protein [Salmonella enterica subsp. enterica serovar Muenster]EAA5984259.1 ead/Ea22-like family protein [Salmonella enterica subsp. enterica serovar Anatum]EAA7423158.1 ead/Ea22-like family protein [Salmonella enterica subsp. enterica serovar Newport]ECC3953654.1 ead/Ea22-like family protein [Salmonella enterica subsp. enterica]ECF0546359.1